MLQVVLEMMTTGMRVDLESLNQLSTQCLELMQEEASKVASIAGYGINPGSPPQVRDYIYHKLGYKATKLTKTKDISTQDKELCKVVDKQGNIIPVVTHILEYRKIAKIRNSYSLKLPRYTVKEDDLDIIHCNIRLTGTDTGRLKVTDPPLQTLPVRTELGKQVRNAFIARPGCQLVFVDLSQIEMRVLADVSNCSNLITLFSQGGDIHTDTATKVFGVSRDEARSDLYRKPIKNVNFGVVYGISAQGLYNLMVENEVEGWDLQACEQLIKDYFLLYPEIKTYTQETIAYAIRNGCVRDMFGRRRIIPEIKSPFEWVRQEGYRQAANGPIQMGAQGILKLATNRIYQDRYQIPFKFLMQVHDELVVECPEDEVENVARFIRCLMEMTTQLSVPILAEASSGASWGKTEKLDL